VPVVRNCQQCGNEFSQGKRSILQKYCSYACSGAARKAKGSKQCVCKTCGSSFTKANSQYSKYKGAGKYCSRKCSYEGIVAETADKPIPDKYGRGKRSADKKWQLAVREKDDYTCQRCGVQDYYVHTHHVATRSTRPDLKHEVSNGKCLCSPCHTWVHGHPLEAAALGLLANIKYEVERRQQMHTEISSTKKMKADTLKEDILSYAHNGMRADAIASKVGLSSTPVRRILKEAGYSYPPGRPASG
jgi:5-methylcytosine-specific restriction endonuclease McrA